MQDELGKGPMLWVASNAQGNAEALRVDTYLEEQGPLACVLIKLLGHLVARPPNLNCSSDDAVGRHLLR